MTFGVVGVHVARNMIAADEIRRLALALPESVEADHHGFPSFRVAGRIFCSLREDRPRMMVKLTAEDQHNFGRARPDAVEPVPGYWGRKGATYVDTSKIDPDLAATLLDLAWSRVAPRRLAAP
ncbi:MAG: MmcQ/YjbR family DNA-binding protein [Caulobacteraceae bacterium]